MIRCGICGEVSEPGKPTYLVITEVRRKVYPQRKNDKRRRTERSFTETAKEVRVCESCKMQTDLFKLMEKNEKERSVVGE